MKGAVMKKSVQMLLRTLWMASLAALLLAVSSLAGEAGSGENADAARIKEEYESYNDFEREDGVKIWAEEIPGENPFVYVSLQQAIELTEIGSGVLFVGSGWCRICRMDILLLLEALQDERADGNAYLEKIYYLNPDEIDENDPLYPEFKEKVLYRMRDYILAFDEPFTNIYGTEKLIKKKTEMETEEFDHLPKYKYEISFWYEGKLLGMNIGSTSHYTDSDTPPGEDDYAEFHERFWEIAGLFGTDLCDYC